MGWVKSRREPPVEVVPAPPPLRSRGLVTGRQMIAEMRRRRMEKLEEGRSLPPGPNPPSSQHGNPMPYVGLTSTNSSKICQTLGAKPKGAGHQAKRKVKGARVITRISERGMPMGDIRDLLVKGEFEC